MPMPDTEGPGIPLFAAAVPIIVAVCTMVAASCAPAAAAAAPYPAEPFVAAAPARDFGNTLGVNVRFAWNDTVYGNYDAMEARLLELGARHVLDGLCAACPYQVAMLQRLSAKGIKADVGVGSLASGSAHMQAQLASVKGPLSGAVEAVVAPNEPDLEPVTDWVTKTRAFQIELWNSVNGDPALAHLPVFGPSLVHRASRAALGDISASLDYGNLHPYPGGIMPLSNFDDERTMMSLVSGSKPLVITEVGYHADTTTDDSHRGVSEAVNASYTPRILLEAYRDGIERTFFYQFVDPFTEAQRVQKGLSQAEGSFGLLRNDLDASAVLHRPSEPDGCGRRRLRAGRLARRDQPRLRGVAVRHAPSPAAVRGRELRAGPLASGEPLGPGRQAAADGRTGRVDVVMGQPLSLAQRFDPVDLLVRDGALERPAPDQRGPGGSARRSAAHAGRGRAAAGSRLGAGRATPGAAHGAPKPALVRPPGGSSSAGAARRSSRRSARSTAGAPGTPGAPREPSRAGRGCASARSAPYLRATWRYARTAGRSEGGPPVKRRRPANSKKPSG